MKSEIDRLYQHLRELPFPKLGKRIGDFPLYDSLLAGVASNYIQQHILPALDSIPCPDRETAKEVSILRQKCNRNPEEVEFLQYFEVLEKFQAILERSAKRSE